MGEIPTIADWAKKQDWYREKTKNIYEEEKSQILEALKTKPIKQVAYEFGRSKETIYNIIRNGKTHEISLLPMLRCKDDGLCE